LAQKFSDSRNLHFVVPNNLSIPLTWRLGLCSVSQTSRTFATSQNFASKRRCYV